MRRNYYSDYVEHCLRYYARNQEPTFTSYTQGKNWIACDIAINALHPKHREIVLAVFRSGDTVQDNVYQCSKEYGMKQDDVWKIVNATMVAIAKERGLI